MGANFMASLAAPDESPVRMSTYGVPLVRPVVPPLTRAPRACPRTDMHGAYYAVIASRERDAHRTKEDNECTQISWSRCCHVAAGCALSMQGMSAGIKETTRTRMKETIRNVRLRRSVRAVHIGTWTCVRGSVNGGTTGRTSGTPIGIGLRGCQGGHEIRAHHLVLSIAY